jgi:DNA-binding response OmpR family regulator
MTKILIVDDDPTTLKLLGETLRGHGYSVAVAHNGRQAVETVANDQPDLVILDVMMPFMDGFAACKRIRTFSNVPIIMVTAKDSNSDIVRGLEIGADDYLPKPYSIDELLARVQAVLRRVQPVSPQGRVQLYQYGDLHVDLTRAQVYLNENPILLTATEYRLLLHFLQHIGEVLSPENLLQNVWGAEYVEDKQILWVTISRLRQKIEPDPKQPVYILTHPGQGYIMPKWKSQM